MNSPLESAKLDDKKQQRAAGVAPALCIPCFFLSNVFAFFGTVSYRRRKDVPRRLVSPTFTSFLIYSVYNEVIFVFTLTIILLLLHVLLRLTCSLLEQYVSTNQSLHESNQINRDTDRQSMSTDLFMVCVFFFF